jgi:hypothetical protein
MAKRKSKTAAATASPDAAVAAVQAQPSAQIIQLDVVRTAAEPHNAEVEQSLQLVKSMEPLKNAAELAFAVGAVAEVKRKHAEVDEVRQTFVGPAQQIVEAANGFFGPALKGLKAAEKELKDRIASFIERAPVERGKLLAEAGAKRNDPAAAQALITQANDWTVPDIAGLSVRESVLLTIADPTTLVRWCVENGRLDLLIPDPVKVEAAMEALEAAGSGIEVPGVELSLKRTIAITESKVVSS